RARSEQLEHPGWGDPGRLGARRKAIGGDRSRADIIHGRNAADRRVGARRGDPVLLSCVTRRRAARPRVVIQPQERGSIVAPEPIAADAALRPSREYRATAALLIAGAFTLVLILLY